MHAYNGCRVSMWTMWYWTDHSEVDSAAQQKVCRLTRVEFEISRHHRRLQCCADSGRGRPRTRIRNFFLLTLTVRGPDDGKQPRTRTVGGSKLHLALIKLTCEDRAEHWTLYRTVWLPVSISVAM